jgi:hypothetical protein
MMVSFVTDSTLFEGLLLICRLDPNLRLSLNVGCLGLFFGYGVSQGGKRHLKLG